MPPDAGAGRGMIRQAVVRPGGGGRRPPVAPGATAAGRPLDALIARELSAYGVRDVLTAPDLDRGGRSLDDHLLLVDGAPLIGDLARFVATPLAAGATGRRLVDADGAWTGLALLPRAALPAIDDAATWDGMETMAAGGTAIDFGLATGSPAARARLDAQLRRPAVFLDRDGVINIDLGYVHRPEELRFTPSAVAGIRAINAAGWLAIVVTNQSGVARGMFGTAEVERFHDAMQQRLLADGAHIDAFYYSPYHPAGSVAAYAIDHEDRKPGPGMVRRAIHDWLVRAEESVMIGDKESDVEAARRAGIRGVQVAADTCDLAAEVAPRLRARV